ncbi:hypothetical protein [Bacillus cihuensis]|uniref:hypothetical protein n=1 Tax=Bacillus cihuensis TaxID=1208599 RepID=UPI0004200C9E|nr:hypothetical protein [Bacillus cihuensis]
MDGADAIAGAEQKVAELQQQINAYRDLSNSLGYEDAETVRRKLTELLKNQ